jgi:hypothetical protein
MNANTENVQELNVNFIVRAFIKVIAFGAVSVVCISIASTSYAYTDNGGKFKIQLPKGWVAQKQSETGGTMTIKAIAPSLNAELHVLVIGTDPIGTNILKSMDRARPLIQEIKPMVLENCPGAVERGAGFTHFGKDKAINVIYSCADNSVGGVWIMPTGTKTYLLTIFGSQSVIGSPEAEKAITSFRILK